jgi:mono/diheme cytochrome c family protein
LCIDCHGVDLKGAPSHGSGPPSGPWAKAAPAIAGLPMFAKDADAMQFLETGKLPDGASARPPMPQYRLDAADAAAVVAYLHSVK